MGPSTEKVLALSSLKMRKNGFRIIGAVLAKTRIKTLAGIASRNRAMETFPLDNLAEKFEVDPPCNHQVWTFTDCRGDQASVRFPLWDKRRSVIQRHPDKANNIYERAPNPPNRNGRVFRSGRSEFQSANL